MAKHDHDMRWAANTQPRGCVHAAFPDGCRGGRMECSCGWAGPQETCGNNASATLAAQDHEREAAGQAALLHDVEAAMLAGAAATVEDLLGEVNGAAHVCLQWSGGGDDGGWSAVAARVTAWLDAVYRLSGSASGMARCASEALRDALAVGQVDPSHLPVVRQDGWEVEEGPPPRLFARFIGGVDQHAFLMEVPLT